MSNKQAFISSQNDLDVLRNKQTVSGGASETERLREALKVIAPYVEFYMKREIESPSNGEEGVRDAREALGKFRAALEPGQPSAPSPEALWKLFKAEALKIAEQVYDDTLNCTLQEAFALMSMPSAAPADAAPSGPPQKGAL